MGGSIPYTVLLDPQKKPVNQWVGGYTHPISPRSCGGLFLGLPERTPDVTREGRIGGQFKSLAHVDQRLLLVT